MSLLSLVVKLLNFVMNRIIMNKLESENILNYSKIGFRKIKHDGNTRNTSSGYIKRKETTTRNNICQS